MAFIIEFITSKILTISQWNNYAHLEDKKIWTKKETENKLYALCCNLISFFNWCGNQKKSKFNIKYLLNKPYVFWSIRTFRL